MSEKSKLVQKSRFHVMYIFTRVFASLGEKLWRDYFGRSFTYMGACEEAEKLRWKYGGKYSFKVVHEKLLKKGA